MRNYSQPLQSLTVWVSAPILPLGEMKRMADFRLPLDCTLMSEMGSLAGRRLRSGLRTIIFQTRQTEKRTLDPSRDLAIMEHGLCSPPLAPSGMVNAHLLPITLLATVSNASTGTDAPMKGMICHP